MKTKRVGNNMKRIKLDWLTVSEVTAFRPKSNHSIPQEVLAFFQENAHRFGMSKHLVPHANRRHMIDSRMCKHTEAVMRLSTNKEGNWTVAEYSGSCLYSSAYARDIVQQLRYAVPDGGVTRFDVAIDVRDDGGKIHERIVNDAVAYAQDHPDKSVATRFSKTGNTVYYGSRVSAVYMRIYQKRFTGDDKLYCRFEVECKPKQRQRMADMSMERMLGNGLYQIRNRVELFSPESLAVLEGIDTKEVSDIRWYKLREESKREKWLYETVLPCFTKFIEQDKQAARQFIAAMLRELHNYQLTVDELHDMLDSGVSQRKDVDYRNKLL